MKRVRVTPEAACTWLKDQIEALDQFRNASTRDASFKQWRQSTLTAIQRIWPGVTARSSRFRRIPFSPPSTLADARQSREAFERGCAEATLLVRGWIAEIESKGILLEDSETSPSEEVAYGAPVLSLDQETPRRDSGGDSVDSGAPPIDLPRSDAMREAGVPVSAAAPKSSSRSKPAKSAGAKADSADRVPAPDKTAKQAKADRTRTFSASARPGRLKDMLGLGHLSVAAGAKDESERFKAVMEEAKSALAEATAAAPSEPPTSDPEPDALILEVIPPASHPAFSMTVPFTLTQVIPPSIEPPDVSDLELTVVNEPVPAPTPQDLERAAEVAGIAREIASYDVPAAESDHVRRTLLDLAHAIERGDPSWDALRAATVVVMHYPKLGRRAMPLLLPLLDRTG